MSTFMQRKFLEIYLEEDDLWRNAYYNQSLPKSLTNCRLKLKDDMMVAGLPAFLDVFEYLLGEKISNREEILHWEGKAVTKSDQVVINFKLPFNVALSGERLALNLLQRASAVATLTKKYTSITDKYQVKLLDTRKTTPGLRALEKYAVRVGGGLNHRFGQTEMWMIKDNHKKIFGGLKNAVNFFGEVGSGYNTLVAEIHSIDELKEAIELELEHVMLDNFNHEQLKEALLLKTGKMTYEVSGGINLNSIESYCVPGVDFISSGSLTNDPPRVDISLKMEKYE